MVGEPLPLKKMTKAEKKELAARSLREPDMFRTFEKSISSYVQVGDDSTKWESRITFLLFRIKFLIVKNQFISQLFSRKKGGRTWS